MPSPREVADSAVEMFLASRIDELVELFDDQMRAAVPAEKVRAVRNRISTSSGPLAAVGEPVVIPQRGATVLDFPVQFARRRGHIQVAVREERVAGLLTRPGLPTGRWKRSRHRLYEAMVGTRALGQ
jgi:hypothetical protein